MTPSEYLKCLLDNNILKIIPDPYGSTTLDYRWKLTADGYQGYTKKGLCAFDWYGLQYNDGTLIIWIPKKVDDFIEQEGDYRGGWKWENAAEVDPGEFNKYAAYILGIFEIESNQEYVDLDNIVF